MLQGEQLGRGGVSTIPSKVQQPLVLNESQPARNAQFSLYRDDDIGLAAPVPLSDELVDIIKRLRDVKVHGILPIVS